MEEEKEEYGVFILHDEDESEHKCQECDFEGAKVSIEEKKLCQNCYIKHNGGKCQGIGCEKIMNIFCKDHGMLKCFFCLDCDRYYHRGKSFGHDREIVQRFVIEEESEEEGEGEGGEKEESEEGVDVEKKKKKKKKEKEKQPWFTNNGNQKHFSLLKKPRRESQEEKKKIDALLKIGQEGEGEEEEEENGVFENVILENQQQQQQQDGKNIIPSNNDLFIPEQEDFIVSTSVLSLGCGIGGGSSKKSSTLGEFKRVAAKLEFKEDILKDRGMKNPVDGAEFFSLAESSEGEEEEKEEEHEGED